ncbi:MAG TPA: hypothetical protein PLD25_07410 [Chloroflexota bacterium]|nr:hypothetical protein [Chloroflexota bacterium]
MAEPALRSLKGGKWQVAAYPFLLIIMLSLLTACGPEPIPTQAASLQLPQPSPTSNLPPTLDISNSQVMETATPAPTLTPKPTRTPTPVDVSINISYPKENELLTLEEEITVGGLVKKEEAHSILVSLVTSNGRVLSQTPGARTTQGWNASFILPPQVSGLAYLRAAVLDEAGHVLAEHQSPVLLALNPDTEGRFLELYRPQVNDTAVGGYSFFFDGMVNRPVNNFITVSIWANECQEQVARQGFQMGSSSRPFYWSGFVVVPKDLVGPACAVAYFGEPGTEEWREAQIPIEVFAQDDANAKGVVVASPRPEAEIFAGEELFLYGTAYNVTNGPVTVDVVMENGRIVGQTISQTDFWGYWEASLLLPFDILGLAEVTITAGEDETLSQTTLVINVLPTPTPTP